MSKTPTTVEMPEEDPDLEEALGIEDGDYAFIIAADGSLKHLYTPEGFYLEPPATVRKILKTLGIKDINAVAFDGNDTLH